MLKRIINLLKISKKEMLPTAEKNIDRLFENLDSETIKILIGSDLESFIEEICLNISLFREGIKENCGFIFPAVMVKSGCNLQENELQIFVNDKLVCTEFTVPNKTYFETNFQDMLQKFFETNLEDIFSNSLVEKYVNQVQKNNCWLVWNLTSRISLVEIKAVLIDLIQQRKSINNITYIFEKMCEQLYLEDSYLERKPHKISERIVKLL